MKYFTTEVILRTRSEDDDSADAANDEWDRLQDVYLARLKEIGPKLPRSLRSLLKRFYLHDAKVSTIALDGGSTLVLTLQLDGSGNGGLQLTYRLTAPLKIHRHPEIDEGATPLEWLYDQFLTIAHVVKDLLFEYEEAAIDERRSIPDGVNTCHQATARLCRNYVITQVWHDAQEAGDLVLLVKMLQLLRKGKIAEAVTVVGQELVLAVQIFFRRLEPLADI